MRVGVRGMGIENLSQNQFVLDYIFVLRALLPSTTSMYHYLNSNTRQTCLGKRLT